MTRTPPSKAVASQPASATTRHAASAADWLDPVWMVESLLADDAIRAERPGIVRLRSRAVAVVVRRELGRMAWRRLLGLFARRHPKQPLGDAGEIRGTSHSVAQGKPPKVLLLLHQLTLTGAPRLALGAFRNLATERDLMIHSKEGGPLEIEFRKLGHLTVLESSMNPLYLKAGMPRKASMRARDGIRTGLARRRARSWHPDAIYVNSIEALPQVPGLDLPRVPVLLQVHESTVALAAFEARHPGLIATIPARYLAVSRVVAGELARRYEVPADRIATIPPFADVPDESANLTQTSGSVAASGHPIIVGGVGNPSWFKGHDLWLLVARDVVAELGADAVRFVWVGVRDNDEGRHFAAMVSKLGLKSVVELVSEVSDPLPIMRGFDLLAVTSWEESASLATLEAMAHGIPVVCFAGSGGPAELIGDTGVVVPAFSPAAMAEVIVDLTADVPRRQRLGNAARERVIRHYARATIVRRIAEEIDALVGRATTS